MKPPRPLNLVRLAVIAFCAAFWAALIHCTGAGL